MRVLKSSSLLPVQGTGTCMIAVPYGTGIIALVSWVCLFGVVGNYFWW